MKNAWWISCIGFALWAACGGVRAGNPQPPPNDFLGIAGRVLARTGTGVSPLGNVVVKVGEHSTVTDESGFWKVTDELGRGDTLAISVRHAGYAPYTQVLPLRMAKGRFVTTSLRPVAATKRIAVAKGGVVVVPDNLGNNAVALRIAPESLKVSAKEVDVAVSIVRPNVAVELATFPGTFLGRSNGMPGGQDLFYTLGALDVSFSANGEALDNVEFDEPAKIQFALDNTMAAGFPEGATIPTWWLDPASGGWTGKGSARVVKQNDRKLATWSASQFNWWGLNQHLESHACLAVRLVPVDDASKLAMQGLLLSISGVDYAGTSPAVGFSNDGLAVITGWRGHIVKPALRFVGAESVSPLNGALAAMFSNTIFALPSTSASTLSGKGPSGHPLVPESDCLYHEYPFALSLGSIKGRVMDEYARPMSGAVVVLPETGHAVVSASDGRYTFDKVPYQKQAGLRLTVSVMPPAQRGGIHFEDVAVERDSNESLVDLVALVRESPPVFVHDFFSNSSPSVKTTIDFSIDVSDEGPRIQWAAKGCGQEFSMVSEVESEPSDKTVVCHLPPGGPTNMQTISAAPDAVAAHLAHGDHLGACVGDDPIGPPSFADTKDSVPGGCSLSGLAVAGAQQGSSYQHRLTGKWTGNTAVAHTLSVVAKDWLGNQSQKDFTIIWRNNPPVFFWDPPRYGRIDDFISVSGIADDADGDPVTVHWIFNGIQSGVGEEAILGPILDGPNYIIAEVSDGRDSITQRYVVYGTLEGSKLAPDTNLTGAPSSPTEATVAAFTFSSPLISATFQCRLDAGAWETCLSPYMATVDRSGVHTFAVRAFDAEGRYDTSPAFMSWDVYFSVRRLLSVGDVHSCSIFGDGILACWGSNAYGEAGLGMLHPQPLTRPTIVTMGPESQRWLTVSAGSDFSYTTSNTCGIAIDLSLWCWGQNRHGVLIPGTAPVTIPTRIGADKNWVDVQAASEFACALKQDRSLYCWGEYGDRTGDGASVVQTSPYPVAGGIAWSMYSIGNAYVCGISVGSSLYCWGGYMPSGTSAQVPTLVNNEIDWVSVSVAPDHACAIKTDHSLWCWGDNENLALGLSGRDRLSPIKLSGNDWLSVSSAQSHTCGLKLDHSLWCWGTEVHGNFGDGPREGAYRYPVRVSFDNDWKELTRSSVSSCARKFNGSLYCWGANFISNLGAGLYYKSAYLRKVNAPAFSMLTELSYTRCGLGLEGELYCAGFNYFGQAGQPISTFVTFSMMASSRRWLAVGLNRTVEASNATCALDTEGYLFCWGSETYGEFGDGETENVGPTPVLAGGGKQWLAFSVGLGHVCAIDTDGIMWCWGLNYIMQSAGAPASNKLMTSPNRLPGTGWSKVEAFNQATCGLQADELKCWGEPVPSIFSYSYPISSTMTPSSVTPGRAWSDFSVSTNSICAIDLDGGLWCWGEILYGHLGSPIAMSMDTDWARVFVGKHHACAIKTNGSMWCFGNVSLVEGMPTDGTVWQIGSDTDWSGYYPGWDNYCALKFDGSMWCAGRQSIGQWGDGGYITFTPQRVLEPQTYR